MGDLFQPYGCCPWDVRTHSSSEESQGASQPKRTPRPSKELPLQERVRYLGAKNPNHPKWALLVVALIIGTYFLGSHCGDWIKAHPITTATTVLGVVGVAAALKAIHYFY